MPYRTTWILASLLLVAALAPTAVADELGSGTPTPAPAPTAEAALQSGAEATGAGHVAACGHANLPEGHSELASKATDPTAALISFRLQNYFIFESMDKSPIEAKGYANQFDVQVVAPIPKFGWFPRSIFRPTIPLVTTPDLELDLPGGLLPSDPDFDLEFGAFDDLDTKKKSKTGLGDIAFVWLPVHDFSWGTVGFGPAGAFPTATDDLLGARKWTLGPAAIVLVKAIPKVQFGALLFNTWSVGGPGDNDVNTMTLQPILTWHFSPSWYTGIGDPAFTFDWEKDNQIYAPLSLRLGKILALGKQHVDVNGQFIYNVGDKIPGKDRWGFKFTLNFLFPAG